MKIVAAILVGLLVAVSDAAHQMSFSAPICEEEVCGCPSAQNPTPENMKYEFERHCYCACGAEKGGECVSEDDCVVGFHCAAGDTLGGFGKCEDACQKPGFKCDIFDKCVINKESAEPECECKIRACTDALIGSGVCAYDTDQSKSITFNNDCLYVNEVCKRRGEDKTALERRQLVDCAEVIQPTMSPVAAVGGWQMAGI